MQIATQTSFGFVTTFLKNVAETVVIDNHVYHWLASDEYLKSVDFLNNLRKHSSGCVVFQKTRCIEKGNYQTETIYLHKLVAEKFLPKPATGKSVLAGMKSDNKLDVRLENLVWRTRAEASRLRKTTGKSGFLGVYNEGRKFRAVITYNGKPIHLGMHETAKEAAKAFNQVSMQLYGQQAKLNQV